MKDSADDQITSSILLQAYASGVFPMADNADADEIFWIDPEKRGIIPLDALHVSRSLRKAVLRQDYQICVNRAFSDTVRACAERDQTWINGEILKLYCELNRIGFAHSIELWSDGALQGGLYGVSFGSAFFGESMFSTRRDASKIALVYLVARLRAAGFRLLDTQFVTDHLARMGAIEISRAEYHKKLDWALERQSNFWALPREADAHSVLQLSTQTS